MRVPLFRIPRVPIPVLYARISGLSCLALACLIVCCAPAARAQQTPQLPLPNLPGVSNTNAPEADPALRRMNSQMILKRNEQRQQQIVNDTTHLLQLAQKLNDEVAKSTKDQLSVSVVKEADEIEKLAKTIKDRMRDGS